MPDQFLVLDGSNEGGPDLGEARSLLLTELERRGAKIQIVHLREEALAHCKGCFGCWLETPGLCRSKDRSGPLLKAMLASTTVVLLTPVTAGGYGSELKRFVDHWIQTTLPFFLTKHGETHHPLRYRSFPRIVAIGVATQPDPTTERLFQAIVARNAVNFSAPSCSAGIVPLTDPAPGIAHLLDTSLPAGLLSMPWPAPDLEPWWAGDPGRALLLVGSPKTGAKAGSGSTSGVLGGHLLDGLGRRGWRTQAISHGGDLRSPLGQERLGAAVEASDLVILAFPLYIDALPCLDTLALEVLALGNLAGKALTAVVNNGFPEAGQNQLALSICARFARETGMAWVGGLALGGGEALSGGLPLTGKVRRGRPPAGHAVKALELAASALAAGRPIPAEAVALLAKSPIPGLPFGLWRRLFQFIGSHQWRSAARKNGVNLLARPLTP